MEVIREKFSTQVKSTLLSEIRTIAKVEGRKINSLVEEAISDLIEKRETLGSRPSVMSAYMRSHKKYAPLYKKLAE